MVGHIPTRAGRFKSPTIRSTIRAMAIRAPVLPEETAATASPARTDSMAFHRLEPAPRRMAWAGLSSEAITLSV